MHIQEILQLHTWTQEDFPTDISELSILNPWGFSLSLSSLPLQSPPKAMASSPYAWIHLPPFNFHKVNFDGTSKRNPGNSGYGAVIRKKTCQIQFLIAENMGYDTNNSMEIWGLIKGIQMDLNHNLTHLIIEGDSKVIIELATKIINGKDKEKITPRWCLLGPLNSLKALLRPSLTLTTSHIRQSANKVVDKLANADVDST
jgi:ribonuclease HI